MYLSKNDMWGSDRRNYYPHLSAGRVGILVAAAPTPPPGLNGSVTMFPGNASFVHTLTNAAGSATVAATTRVLENNAIVTTLVCTSPSGGACPVELLLSDTDGNHYGVARLVYCYLWRVLKNAHAAYRTAAHCRAPLRLALLNTPHARQAQDAGAAPGNDLVWWRKENLIEALNPAYVGSCDPHMPLQSVERRFIVGAGGALQMVNGSCLWADETANASRIITSGDCALPQGKWEWTGSKTKGEIKHTASSKCLSPSLALGTCGATPWAQASSGSANASHVYLSTGTTGCLVAVPDNNNNTLARPSPDQTPSFRVPRCASRALLKRRRSTVGHTLSLQ